MANYRRNASPKRMNTTGCVYGYPYSNHSSKTGRSWFESARGNLADKADLRLGPVFGLGEVLLGHAVKSVPGGLVSIVGLFRIPDHGPLRNFEGAHHARLILDDKADV